MLEDEKPIEFFKRLKLKNNKIILWDEKLNLCKKIMIKYYNYPLGYKTEPMQENHDKILQLPIKLCICIHSFHLVPKKKIASIHTQVPYHKSYVKLSIHGFS
jgi:hypothetical protein